MPSPPPASPPNGDGTGERDRSQTFKKQAAENDNDASVSSVSAASLDHRFARINTPSAGHPPAPDEADGKGGGGPAPFVVSLGIETRTLLESIGGPGREPGPRGRCPAPPGPEVRRAAASASARWPVGPSLDPHAPAAESAPDRRVSMSMSIAIAMTIELRTYCYVSFFELDRAIFGLSTKNARDPPGKLKKKCL